MAAPAHPKPGKPTPPATGLGRVTRWQVLGAALAVALLAVALAQARQFALLRQADGPGNDAAVMAFFEMETAYLRLRGQWRTASDERVPLDGQALRQHYRLWVDRVALLRAAPQRGPAAAHDRHDGRATLQQVDAFIAGADRALGAQPQIDPNRSFVDALQPALEALDAPLQDIATANARHAAAQRVARAEAAHRQGTLAIALTTCLSLLALALAALAMQLAHRLRRRRAAAVQAASELQAARQQLADAQHAHTLFLAHLGRDLRTPLHGLMGMLDLLRDAGLGPRQIDQMRAAAESSNQLLGILDDLLDLSQLQSGQLVLAPAAVDVRAMLRTLETQTRPQALAKGLALHVDADPGVPARVWADAARITQVLGKLLSSAIRSSDRGAVVLDARVRPGSRTSVRARAHAQAGHRTDSHGPFSAHPGADPADHMGANRSNAIWLEFVVAEAGTGRPAAGTAPHLAGADIGLDTACRLARLMGGDIHLRSASGAPGAFTFALPVQAWPGDAPEVAAVQRPARPPAFAESSTGSAPGAAAALRPLRVLVAEDHPVNRQYMAALLETLGHQAHFAGNGQEALQALQALAMADGRPFDVVLMDLHMPVLDGLAATREMRALADPGLSTVPIVGLTADAFDATRDRCLVAGMNDFLTKPVSAQQLAASLRRLFGAESAPAGSPPRTGDTPSSPTLLSPPLLDEAALARLLRSLPAARLGRQIQAFLDQAPAVVQGLRAAVREGHPLDLRVHAGAARAAALPLGLGGLAATAQALHEGAAHLPAHEIAHLVQRFEQQLPLTQQAAAALGLLPAPSGQQAPGAG